MFSQIKARSRDTDLIFDKSFTNGRVRAYASADNPGTEKCCVCKDKDDSLSHLILECSDTSGQLNSIREEIHTAQVEAMQEIDKHTIPARLSTYFTNLIKACWNKDSILEDMPSRYWRGLLNEDMLHRTLGDETNAEMPNAVFRLMKGSTEKLLQPLMSGMHRLIVARAKISKAHPKAKDANAPGTITAHPRLIPRKIRVNSIRKMLRKGYRPPALTAYSTRDHDIARDNNTSHTLIRKHTNRHRIVSNTTILSKRRIAPANQRLQRTGTAACTRKPPSARRDG